MQLIHFRSILYAHSLWLRTVRNWKTGTTQPCGMSGSERHRHPTHLGNHNSRHPAKRTCQSHLVFRMGSGPPMCATCLTTTFTRNKVEYRDSHERSSAKFTFTSHTRKTKPGLLTGGKEILLGHGICMPASKQAELQGWSTARQKRQRSTSNRKVSGTNCQSSD